MALFGCTFTNRKVGSRDLGALFRALLADGRITGMGLTRSGSTLSIAQGYAIACGRVFGNDAALSLSMTQTSGYARVVIKIDLTGAATAETFGQLSTRIDYASSADGFADLVQQDVNDGTHTTYEVELCVVNISGSGNSSFVRTLPAAALAAGSVGYDQLRPGAVTSSRLGEESVGEDQLADRGVTSVKIGLQAVKWENIKDDAITGSKIDNDNTYPHNVGIRHGTASTMADILASIPKNGQIYLKHS